MDTKESARFFAKILLEDARRKTASGKDSSFVDEAREFYQSRVQKNLWVVFDEVLSE